MEQNKDRVQIIVDRMKKVLGVTKDKDLAAAFGGSRSTPAAWKVRGSIPFTECVVLAETKGISLDWLILGRGPDPTEALAASGEDIEPLQSFFVPVPAFNMASSLQFDEMPPDHVWNLPRVWIENEGLVGNDTIVVIAAGDSMQPTIKADQLVVVDRRPRDTDGVFLVRFGDKLRFKRIQRMLDGSTRFSSDNAAYAAETLPPGEESKIEIIGYCHALLAQLR